MNIIDRWVRCELEENFNKPFVHIIFGARQTGKTTLIQEIIQNPALSYNLADPEETNNATH